MSNAPSWMSKWARSPRQDRRVIEDGKFVELGKVQLPEPTPEVPEREQSALEIVKETANVTEQEQISGTVFEEGRYEPIDAGTSADGNVPLDAPNGSSDRGHETSGQSNDANPRETVGTTEEISDPFVSTTEATEVNSEEDVDKAFKILPIPPIPDEAFEFIEEAQKANEAISGIPGNLLTEEQSDALAETLRLPESTEDDIPF